MKGGETVQHHHPAIVLDLSANGIGIIRSLAKKGVTVYGFDVEKKYRLGKTRYATCSACPDPAEDAEKLLAFLLEKRKLFATKPVLYAGSDEFVAFISTYRKQLEAEFLFLLPEHDLIEAVLDKRKTAELAQRYHIPSPKSVMIYDDNDLQIAVNELTFPCILKPVRGHEFRKKLSKKAIVMENKEQLLSEYDMYSQFGELFIQEIIPGAEHCIYQVGTFFNKEMELVGQFMGQKLNQFPPYFGAGARVLSVVDKEVLKAGTELLRMLNFKGLAVAEFKRDPRDHQLKFIEINARTWLWHSLSGRCQIDLSYLYYLSLTGQKPKPRLKQIEGIEWIYLVRDFLSTYEKRKKGDASFKSWFIGLFRKKDHALVSIYDPMPFIRITVSHLVNAWKNKKVTKGVEEGKR